MIQWDLGPALPGKGFTCDIGTDYGGMVDRALCECTAAPRRHNAKAVGYWDIGPRVSYDFVGTATAFNRLGGYCPNYAEGH
ncbi:MAG: hypothetical protein GDA36_12975 [Rhodobacteraceae bacterium]|nr:hypothetical protein [Paracoccaceae bacterium]